MTVSTPPWRTYAQVAAYKVPSNRAKLETGQGPNPKPSKLLTLRLGARFALAASQAPQPNLDNLPAEIVLMTLQYLSASDLARVLQVSKRLQAVVLAQEDFLAGNIALAQKDRLQEDVRRLDFSGVEIAVALRRYVQHLGHSFCRETDWFNPSWRSRFAELYAQRKISDGATGSLALANQVEVGLLVHALFALQRSQALNDPTYPPPINFPRRHQGLSYPAFAALIRRHWNDLAWSDDELCRTYNMMIERTIFGEGSTPQSAVIPCARTEHREWRRKHMFSIGRYSEKNLLGSSTCCHRGQH